MGGDEATTSEVVWNAPGMRKFRQKVEVVFAVGGEPGSGSESTLEGPSIVGG